MLRAAVLLVSVGSSACWHSSAGSAAATSSAEAAQPAPRHVDTKVLARCTEAVQAWSAKHDACERNPPTRDGFTFPCPPMGFDVLAATACANLYSQQACRDAWTTTSTPEGAVGGPYAEIVKPCAAAYCAKLPSPRPAACSSAGVGLDSLLELDTAILVYEGVPADRAALLARRRDPMTSLEMQSVGP